MPARTGAEPRLVAARALAGVLDGGRNLTEALAGPLAALVESRDRALARRLAHAVLRDLPALEFRLKGLVRRNLPRRARVVHFLLLSALAELSGGREPPPAVVHASVAAVRRAGQPGLAGLVNAVLRNYLRRREAIEAVLPDTPAMRHGYPDWLVARIRADWPGDWAEILAAGNRPPPVWLRVNRRRIAREDYRGRLEAAGLAVHMPDRPADALRLETPARISELPGYREGLFAVQDAGAQWAVEWLELADGQRVLDACAAPGGKAAHILERAEVELTALEIDPDRAATTAAGLERLGLEARLVTADAACPEDWWDGTGFDRILVDAPCSATGVIRRHPDIRWLRTEADVDAAVAVQHRLLDALWPLLRPGGMLVYGTCSVLAAENRGQARRFLDDHDDARCLDLDPVPGRPQEPGRQILPGDDDMDGFYYCRLGRLDRLQPGPG